MQKRGTVALALAGVMGALHPANALTQDTVSVNAVLTTEVDYTLRLGDVGFNSSFGVFPVRQRSLSMPIGIDPGLPSYYTLDPSSVRSTVSVENPTVSFSSRWVQTNQPFGVSLSMSFPPNSAEDSFASMHVMRTCGQPFHGNAPFCGSTTSTRTEEIDVSRNTFSYGFDGGSGPSSFLRIRGEMDPYFTDTRFGSDQRAVFVISGRLSVVHNARFERGEVITSDEYAALEKKYVQVKKWRDGLQLLANFSGNRAAARTIKKVHNGGSATFSEAAGVQDYLFTSTFTVAGFDGTFIDSGGFTKDRADRSTISAYTRYVLNQRTAAGNPLTWAAGAANVIMSEIEQALNDPPRDDYFVFERGEYEGVFGPLSGEYETIDSMLRMAEYYDKAILSFERAQGAGIDGYAASFEQQMDLYNFFLGKIREETETFNNSLETFELEIYDLVAASQYYPDEWADAFGHQELQSLPLEAFAEFLSLVRAGDPRVAALGIDPESIAHLTAEALYDLAQQPFDPDGSEKNRVFLEEFLASEEAGIENPFEVRVNERATWVPLTSTLFTDPVAPAPPVIPGTGPMAPVPLPPSAFAYAIAGLVLVMLRAGHRRRNPRVRAA